MRVVIETSDKYKAMLQEIATAIQAKITFEEKEADFWEELPEHVKLGILESQEQFRQGKFTEFDIVREELLSRNHRK